MSYLIRSLSMEAFLKSIPKEWKVLKLYEVASVRGGSKIRAHINRRHYSKIAFIPMDLIPQEGIYCNYELRDPEDIRSYVYCRAGDILLAKITPSFENGKQGIVPLDVPGGFALATTEVYPIAPDETKIDRMFLFYLLKWHPYRKYLEHRMRGTTGRRRVPRDALLNLNIPLPPLDEQRKIARILYTVDEAIAKTDAIISRVEELRRALLDYLMTHGIGHKEYKETEIGKIPKEWRVVELREVAIVKHGKRPRTMLESNGFPIFGAGGFAGYTDNYLVDDEFTVVVARVGAGSVGKVYLAKGKVWISDNALYIQCNKNLIYPPYLYYSLVKTNPRRMAYKAAGGHAVITRSLLENLKIPLPPLEEQVEIAKVLGTIDKLLEVEITRKEAFIKLKNSLMNLLLTGKVRVKDLPID